MPVHPLLGQRLPAIRSVRGRDGRRYIEAEHPRGWHIRLPIEWTDRAASPGPTSCQGEEVRLSFRGLLALAGAVDVALGRVFNLPMGLAKMDEDFGSKSADAPEDGPSVPMGSTLSGDTPRPTRRVGHLGAQDASGPDACRGGDRR